MSEPTPPLAPLPAKIDLELARRETVAILRRMADLIEQEGDGRGSPATLQEIHRLRHRAARLRAELRWRLK